jgi:uncharacterized protein YqeY
MSELLKQIKLDQVAARKLSDTITAGILTTLLGEASPSGKDTTTDAKVLAVIKKFVKNLNETVPLMTNPIDIGIGWLEISILKEYLPKQIEGSSLENLIYDLINHDGCDNLGKVMKALNGAFGGQFDGKEASKIAKAHLGI